MLKKSAHSGEFVRINDQEKKLFSCSGNKLIARPKLRLNTFENKPVSLNNSKRLLGLSSRQRKPSREVSTSTSPELSEEEPIERKPVFSVRKKGNSSSRKITVLHEKISEADSELEESPIKNTGKEILKEYQNLPVILNSNRIRSKKVIARKEYRYTKYKKQFPGNLIEIKPVDSCFRANLLTPSRLRRKTHSPYVKTTTLNKLNFSLL
mmetsp:Transcript_2702/g.4215  ORF Transcript_2702/g.4215 Transcript_2702/m.4215 type:complete len:209 (+) Transcript_2702:4-630(+)